MTTERQRLTRHLDEILIPAFEQAGFVRLPLDGDDAKSPEIRSVFPFGRLRRPCAGGVEQVEIQLDKNKLPAFRINFAVIPAGGIQHAVGPVKLEDMWIHYLDRYNVLYERGWTRRWFAAAQRAGAGASDADYRALVERVAALLPEVERAFDTHARMPWGGHVRRVG